MTFFGLDIGSSSLKAVEVKRDGKGSTLQLYASVALKSNMGFLADTEGDLKVLSSNIKEFIESYPFSSNKVIVALPESQIFTRVITLPKITEKELANTMQWEAQQYIPVPLTDVSLDFQIIDGGSSDNDKMDVLLIAAPKNLVQKYLKVLKDASLDPIGLETETMAVSRSLVSADPGTPPTMIVNIGAMTTDLAVVSKKSVRFTRSISTGGNAMARAISQALGFDLNQAEEYKKTYGLDQTQLEGKIMQAIKPIFDVVVDEVKRSAAFYGTHNREDKIKRVILCGGTASLPGIIVYMAASMDIEVQLGDPWQKIYIPSKFSRKELEGVGPSFSVAAGLAIKEI